MWVEQKGRTTELRRRLAGRHACSVGQPSCELQAAEPHRATHLQPAISKRPFPHVPVVSTACPPCLNDDRAEAACWGGVFGGGGLVRVYPDPVAIKNRVQHAAGPKEADPLPPSIHQLPMPTCTVAPRLVAQSDLSEQPGTGLLFSPRSPGPDGPKQLDELVLHQEVGTLPEGRGRARKRRPPSHIHDPNAEKSRSMPAHA